METSTFDPLNQLPLELITCIVESLPLESAAALSLTCRYLYSILEEKYLQVAPHLKDPSSYSFALLLERDLPDHIACFHCRSFHCLSDGKANDHTLSSESILFRTPCMKHSHEIDETDMWISWYFNAVIFRMAMKRQRQMRPYEHLLNLLSSKFLKLPSEPSYQICRSSSARIHDNTLLIRNQTIYAPSVKELAYDWWSWVYPRIYIKQGNETRRSYRKQQTWQSILLRKGLVKYRFCRTEFRIDFKKINGVWFFMFITVWKDHGQGKSHLDRDWQSHVKGARQKVCSRVEFELDRSVRRLNKMIAGMTRSQVVKKPTI